MNKSLLSSKHMDWATPKDLFDRLNDFFHFTLDPCASKENAKCEKFYTIEDDGLKQDWSNNVVFCNPPYGSEISNWVKKSYEESCKENTTVVMLIPSRTDTKYFHNYIMLARKIWFINGRVKFEKEGHKSFSAPFPSMIAIFNGKCEQEIKIETFNLRKRS